MRTVNMRIMMQWRFSLSIGLLIVWGLGVIGTSSAIAQAAGEDVNYEAGFYYTVKKGDTLWDLSQRFNDTPWQWPDLWEENKQIANPHWIYPGERIRLYRKTDQHRYEKSQKELQSPDAQITATAPKPEPAPPVVEFHYAGIDRVGFIRLPAVEPLGTIFKARDNRTLISKGDTIYIRHSTSAQNSEMSPGRALTIYRTLSPTDDRYAEQTIGTQHLMLGIGEVIKNEAEYALIKVIHSYRAINIGDLVMAYTPRNPDITVVNSTPEIEGHIICSEEHTKYMGELFIAFIDKGTQDNIVPGQIYHTYYMEDPELDKIDNGSIFVLHTEQTTATVVVTDSDRQLVPGQPFHTP